MKVKEITLANIVQAGTDVSAGYTNKRSEPKTMIAQYPSERSAGNDASDMQISDLYRNGLLFTAYDYKSRTTPDMRGMRKREQNKVKALYEQTRTQFNRITSGITSESPKKSVSQDPVANILMPRSKSDSENINHKFNDVGDSLITKGGGTMTGVISNMASTAVFGAIESMTQGLLSDKGEQIYTTARSMYAGPENRTKVYSWELTPRTIDDLVQIIRIYEIFNFYSYGMTGNSQYAKELKGQIDEWYKKTFINNLTPEGSDRSGTMMESVTAFLSNVIVVTNPTVWFVRNFGKTTKFDGRPDVFGPAQIQSIRFDKAPDGNFRGLSIAPNMPSTFVLEVTMREILTLSRGTLYGDDTL